MVARIALDAMGGDHAPKEIVAGALAAAREFDIEILLVGRSAVIEAELRGAPAQPRIRIIEAPDVIEMVEHATDAVRAKPNASINVGIALVKSGAADAFVTAGNTGATMAAALLTLGRVRGIGRPALGSVMPTGDGGSRPCLWLDIGANADCRPIHLIQFAHMGSAYMERVFSKPRPAVALLSIGEEDSKGNQLVLEVNEALRASDLNFVGNVEGKDLPKGVADVVVMDGFTGNVVLKTVEGVAEMLFGEIRKAVYARFLNKLAGKVLYGELKKVRQRIDYSEYGGAQLLGVDGICVIGHGRSNARAVFSAVRAAKEAVDTGVLDVMREVARQVPAKRAATSGAAEDE